MLVEGLCERASAPSPRAPAPSGVVAPGGVANNGLEPAGPYQVRDGLERGVG